MGNLCSSPADFLQQFKAPDSRSSIDTLEVIMQRNEGKPPSPQINNSQKDLLGLCHDRDIRRQFETKLRNENKIKTQIEAITNIEGFDYNGDLAQKRIPSKKLLKAKVEINRTKNVYEKEIEHEVSLHHIPIDPIVSLSKEIGYYRKE